MVDPRWQSRGVGTRDGEPGAAGSAEQAGLDLRLLGPVHALRGGSELVLGSARRTAVLCVLALHPGQQVSRDELVSAVWGEDPPSSATGNIYTYVSTLRQMLEPTRDRWTAGRLFSSGGGTYQLHLPPECVDVLRFESLRLTARRQRSAGDVDAEVDTVAQALRLWRGEALAGVPGPFAEGQRLRLTELRLATAERYVALLTGCGRHEEAARVLDDLVAAYPHRGDLRARLAAVPPVPGASVPPGDGGRPRGDGAADGGREIRTGGGPPAGPRVDATPLFGRDAALRRLRRGVADAVGGRGGSILVEGPAGIGRTALLTAALGSVPDGCRIGWAVGDEGARDVPLGVLRDCVGAALTSATTRVPVAAADPAGDDRPATAAGSGGDDTDRVGSDDAARMVDLVRRATAGGPLVLTVDDLHWADPTTLRAWATLSGQAAGLPLLLVGTVRSGAGPVAGWSVAEVVTLGPLDPSSAGALVRALAPRPPGPQELARLLDQAGGHPDYLRQLARHGSDPFPPAGLVAAVGAHLSPYPEELRRVLRAVAFLSAYEVRSPGTLPEGCTMAELAAATDHGVEDLGRIVAPARAAGVLASGDRLRLRHRVVVRVLHESTPAAFRVALSRQYAKRLAVVGAAPERVAALLLAGEVPFDDRTAGWLAGQVEQIAEASPQIAVAALAQAHAQHALAPDRRLTLTAWLARLLLRAGQHAAAEAGWVAARTADPELAGEMRWTAAHSHERRGDFETAAEIAHTALRERRIGPQWIDELRALLGRIRPSLPGNPTEPQLSRSGLVGGTRDAP
ncbi:BTAD domain-containing putative transcriptional regulator [Micromonospora sp. HUAS LYJ1]|uniref:BTAD domain-containing putative transcriptional regulator n=1 Tax=Micromonospora sp. HUAS LYJ1 TaxID=3061626 RepID=UPI00267213C2|nr:BTAD domain-containing putative transcriptional regulator [Micromonospora sp. HUAS LYJ1]WKU05746.1 BTAD domain-containing putative transcriptional regulator [Micromonospora sp. HUAS LYJ1]